MTTLSVVISVFNGEKFLASCLKSVQDIADEIIVVDHESTDKTVEIAKKFTKKIYREKNDINNIDMQKNFGFAKASREWILSLDADETVTPELAEEIRSMVNDKSSIVNGYSIPRKNIIFGKWIQHTGWYPDYQLRLFKKGKGAYASTHVHEHIVVEGTVAKLRAPLQHENYQTIYQFLHRGLTIYAPNEAQAMKDNGYTFSYADAIRFPFKEFISRFFAREGYLDGFHGFMLSLLMSAYHFAIFAYLWEHNKFPDNANGKDILSQNLPEVKKDYMYWQEAAAIKKAKNPTKTFLKIKRKLGL